MKERSEVGEGPLSVERSPVKEEEDDMTKKGWILRIWDDSCLLFINFVFPLCLV